MTTLFPRLLVGLLAMVLVAACKDQGSGEPPPADGAGTGAFPRPDTDLLPAMQTVYFFVHIVREAGQEDPPRRVMRLQDAARIIKADGSFGSSTRRRRAIGKLGAAYKLLTGGGDTRPRAGMGVDDVREALGLLGAPAAVLKPGVPGHGDFPTLENEVYAKLDSADDPTPTKLLCCSCVETCDVYTNKGTGKVSFDVRVKRTFPSLNEVTDPQSWARCNPLAFQRSDFAGTDCDETATTLPPKGPSPPTPGSEWTGMLAEHFANQFGVTFENILAIEPGPKTGTARVFEYTLCRAVSGTATIKVDCGEAGALSEDVPPFTQKFSGFKHIELDGVSSSTYVMELLVDETALVGVCCDLNEPPCECKTPTCGSLRGPGSVEGRSCPLIEIP